MAAGFNSPNILFLNTYDALDRRYMSEIIPKLNNAGYDRYVELYAGGFAMPFVAASAGMKAGQIKCYDFSLYGCILGYLFAGKDLNELDVRRDGKKIRISSKDQCVNAAILLVEQAKARFEKTAGIYYIRNLIKDIENRYDEHVKDVADRLRRMDELLHGIQFERLYIWDAFEQEKDAARTFIVSNPPTYKGAYEKFFDTGGRITWVGDAEKYEIWDGSIHCRQLMEKAKDAAPLVFLLQQARPGFAATEHPIFGRYLSTTQNVYYNSNRPEEVEQINGLKVETLKDISREKSKYPIMDHDYKITEDSEIRVFVEETKIAEYYRKMWLHRITGKAVSINLCVVADGKLLGFIGLDFRPLIGGFKGDENFYILSYAVAAPGDAYRYARLMVHIAKSLYLVRKAIVNSRQRQYATYLVKAKRINTVEYSRYPEINGLRGLMKLEGRKRINDELNALQYYGELTEKTEKEVIAEFLSKEKKYAEERKSS